MTRKSVFILLAAVILAVSPQIIYAGWMRTYGGEEPDGGYCVQETSDGGYIMTGFIRSFGYGNNDLWLLRVDAKGDTLWTRIYGGEESDAGRVVRQTTDGGFIILGVTSSFGNDGPISWLLKTDSSGDTLWTRTYEGGYRIEQITEGNYIITGVKNRQLCLIRIDSLGEVIWERTYSGEGYDYTMSSCVKQTSEAGYIITGSTSESNLFLVKTDSLGDILWETTYELDRGVYVEELEDGGYIIAGATETEPWHIRICLLEADSLGEVLRTQHWEEMQPAEGKPLTLTENGGYVLAGYGPVLMEIDADWSTLWTRTYGTGYLWWMERTSDGGYIITGDIYYPDTEDYDLWLIKTDSLGYVEIEEEPPVTHQPDWQVTPIGSPIVFRYSDSSEGFHASIFDATGRKVDEIKAGESSGTITWGERQTSGVYFIKVDAETPCSTLKVILIN